MRIAVIILITLISEYFINPCPAIEEPGRKTKIRYSQQKISGEYLITTNPDCPESAIKDLFTKYTITKFRFIKENVYLIKIKSDPGIKILKTRITDSCVLTIQPNSIFYKNK